MGEKENRAKLAMHIYERIASDTGILKVNRDCIKSYLSFMQAKGLEVRTIEKNLYSMERFLKVTNPKIEFKKAEKEDLQDAMAKLQIQNYSPETKRMVRTAVKSFYKHLLGDDEIYPRLVSWIKTGGNTTKKMLPEDLLSEDEIFRMIENTDSLRNKAILALLYDTGIRCGELLSIRVKDVDLSSEPGHVTVSGKTGMRQIPILFSAPYMASYLSTVKKKQPNDSIWKAIGSWSDTGRDINSGAVSKLLKVTAKRAGINKNVYPHLFRHSRASYYANRITEQQLKVFFGWAGSSKQAATYVHLSGRDIDNAIMKAYGMKVAEEAVKPKLTIQICPRCRQNNSMSSLHCSRCGGPLDIATAIKEDEIEKTAEEALAESLKERELIDRLEKQIVEKKRKNKK